jgi:hypothetical protein
MIVKQIKDISEIEEATFEVLSQYTNMPSIKNFDNDSKEDTFEFGIDREINDFDTKENFDSLGIVKLNKKVYPYVVKILFKVDNVIELVSDLTEYKDVLNKHIIKSEEIKNILFEKTKKFCDLNNIDISILNELLTEKIEEEKN